MIVINEKEYVRSCTCIDDNGQNKLVLRTVECAHYVTITDSESQVYGEITNLGEPFDFATHAFYIPKEALTRPLTVRFTNLFVPSKFFSEKGEEGYLTLSPESITTTDRESFIALCDRKLTVNKVTDGTVCDGVNYKTLECQNAVGAPVRAYALLIDPDKAEFATGTAKDGYAPHTDIQTVKEQAEAAIANGRKVVAATNADFFDMFGNNAPAGLCIKDGKSIANADTIRNFFAMDRNGRPVISSFVQSPHLVGQLRMAVGGREIYLQDGKLAELSLCEPFSSTPHPRTTVGICADGTVIILVVDGRLPDISNGASLVDLARLMTFLGARTAINLDGGGSSTMLVNIDGELTMLNRPADLVRPTEALIRPIFNSIQVVLK